MVGAAEDEHLYQLLEDDPLGDARAVASERMVGAVLGKEGLKLLEDGLDEVRFECGHGAYSFCSGSVENSPNDGASVPALHHDALPIDGTSYRPDWSPDGSQIAFECYDDPCYEDPSGNSDNPEIYKANANGAGNPIRLTNDPATDTYPAFAPVGGKIVYSSNSDGDFDLYIINADGTDEPQPLTGKSASDSARDVLPDWQPVR